MRPTDIEQRVRQIQWPAPPASLRDRVLSSPAGVAPPITWSDRVWFSRAWRLSAIGAVLVVVGLEYLSGQPRSAGVAPTDRVLATAQVIDETSREVGLPEDVAASLARRALSEAARPAAPERERTTWQAFAPEGQR